MSSEFCRSIELQKNQTLPVLNFTNVNVSSLLGVCRKMETLELESATEAKYSQPMWLIGLYIAMASELCGTLILFDIIVGIFMKRFWVPTQFFSLNAASLTLMAVAMKLPMDLTTPMPDELDQVVKVGSLGFLCMIISNLIMPSLAGMDSSNSLRANVTALFILVITIVINVGIQIGTQVITHTSFHHPFSMTPLMAAYIYMGMLLFLLIIYISIAIAVPSLKKVLELKYKATLIDEHNLQENFILYNVEELRQFVRRHWIMAMTSCPQFVLATTPLSSASGVICAINMIVYISLSWHALQRNEKSVYKVVSGICVAQCVGVVGGAIGSIYRCFAVLSFKLSANRSINHFSVLKVDKYWTQQLCEWREYSSASLSIDGINYRLNNNILRVCIGFQKAIVVLCKIIELIPVVVIISVTYCSYYFKSMKALLFTPHTASSSENVGEDLSNYVLSLEDNVQVTKYSYKRFLDSMNAWISVHQYFKPYNNLRNLVEKSVAFEGVETFDNDQIHSLLLVELVNSWSLPIISLTCIAMAIPNIDKAVVDNLVKSVGEGLFFTHYVEESLNRESVYVNIRRATEMLWHEVEANCKWLGMSLKRSGYEGKTPIEIINSFARIAKDIVTEFNISTNREPVEKNLPSKVIAANSMYRVTQTIVLDMQATPWRLLKMSSSRGYTT
ncbi:uncharacterized protein LOC143579808 [Bidens hawaiensis]|uniref:uncharacterized protein LOC143579808 n=1 Tax=Bidens hawaiensis TaxID=980011 RepID=UPI00404A5C94